MAYLHALLSLQLTFLKWTLEEGNPSSSLMEQTGRQRIYKPLLDLLHLAKWHLMPCQRALHKCLSISALWLSTVISWDGCYVHALHLHIHHTSDNIWSWVELVWCCAFNSADMTTFFCHLWNLCSGADHEMVFAGNRSSGLTLLPCILVVASCCFPSKDHHWNWTYL